MDTDKLDPSVLSRYAQTCPSDAGDWDQEETVIGNLPQTHAQSTANTLILEGMGHRCTLGLTPVLLGRDAGCTLTLNARTISRYHLALYPFGKHYWLRDLHSTNGVFLNQFRTRQAVIRAGDRIQVGDQHFQILSGPLHKESYARECVVVFLDLADSTHWAEKEGESFSQAIQAEISRLEDRVLIYRGIPLKHLGDGLMCAFGLSALPPNALNAADQALLFAWEAVKAFRTLPAYPHLRLRAGLHFGEVTLIQEETCLDLLGDTVNLASRLESCNKEYGTHILVSQSLQRQTQRTRSYLRELDTVRLPGKTEAITLYGWDESCLHPGADAIQQAYGQALQLYRQGRFAEARACLSNPALAQDPPTQALLRRIYTWPDQTPPSWEGIWQLEK